MMGKLVWHAPHLEDMAAELDPIVRNHIMVTPIEYGKGKKIDTSGNIIIEELDDIEDDTIIVLSKNNYEMTSVPLIGKMGAYMGINMEVMKDNSDSRMADMLIQGLTMGILNITKNLGKYKNEVDKEVIKIAKDYKKHQEETIEKIKRSAILFKVTNF